MIKGSRFLARLLRNSGPLIVCVLTVFLNACVLKLQMSAGGMIVSDSGAWDCDSGECRIDITEGFEETFTAVAEEGYAFDKWVGLRHCTENPVCRVSSAPVPESWLDTEHSTILRALFVRDTFVRHLDIDDAGLRTCLMSNVFEHQYESAQQVTELECKNSGFRDISGLRHFPNLEKLVLRTFEFSAFGVDLSSNPKLVSVDLNVRYMLGQLEILDMPNLESLSVSSTLPEAVVIRGNPRLTSINLSLPQLQSLSIEDNASLTDLSIDENSINSIDLTDALLLQDLTVTLQEGASVEFASQGVLSSLSVYGNIEGLDLSQTPHIRHLLISNVSPVDLDLRSLPALESLYVYKGDFSNINLQGNPLLREIRLTGKSLTSLNVASNTALELLSSRDLSIAELDVTSNHQLKILSVGESPLETLLVGADTVIEYLYLQNTRLTEIDLEGHSQLKRLTIRWAPISSIDLGNNALLERVDLRFNQLTEINTASNPLLIELSLHANAISTIDLSNNPLLYILGLGCNALTEVNLAGLEDLSQLHLRDNQIETIDLAPLGEFRTVDLRNNPLDASTEAYFEEWASREHRLRNALLWRDGQPGLCENFLQ